jgi:hypothetical protein
MLRFCGLTFELTPTAEAGGVSPVTDDATTGGRPAYDPCRSGSGAERGVRPHAGLGVMQVPSSRRDKATAVKLGAA